MLINLHVVNKNLPLISKTCNKIFFLALIQNETNPITSQMQQQKTEETSVVGSSNKSNKSRLMEITKKVIPNFVLKRSESKNSLNTGELIIFC